MLPTLRDRSAAHWGERAALDGSPDEQRDHGTDHRSDQAGHLEPTIVAVLAEREISDEPVDGGPDDPEQDRLGDGHRSEPETRARGQQTGNKPITNRFSMAAANTGSRRHYGGGRPAPRDCHLRFRVLGFFGRDMEIPT